MQSYTTATVTIVKTVSEPGKTTTTTETRTTSTIPSVPSTTPEDEQAGQQDSEEGDAQSSAVGDDAIDEAAADPEADNVEPAGDEEQFGQTGIIEEPQAEIFVVEITQSVDVPPEQSARVQNNPDASNEQGNVNNSEQGSPTKTSNEAGLNESSENVSSQASEPISERLVGGPSIDTGTQNPNETEDDGNDEGDNTSAVQHVTETFEREPSDENEGPDLNETETNETQNDTSPEPITEILEGEPSNEDEHPDPRESQIGQQN